MLEYEIRQSRKRLALWEKKGSSLYTARNVSTYPELRKFTNRLFSKIAALDGFVFYVGTKKTALVADHNPNLLYRRGLREVIKRLNDFCAEDCPPATNFVLALDEHDQREALITEASRSMFGGPDPQRHLVEPPFQFESHRYQTLQAADWIAGLIGRLGAYWKGNYIRESRFSPDATPERLAVESQPQGDSHGTAGTRQAPQGRHQPQAVDEHVPAEEAAREWLESEIRPGGPHCPHCGSANVRCGIRHRSMTHRCRDCPNRPQFGMKTGNVMQGTKLGCRDWAIAIHLLTTNLEGVSGMKLHRDLEITRKSAWHLLHRRPGEEQARGQETGCRTRWRRKGHRCGYKGS